MAGFHKAARTPPLLINVDPLPARLPSRGRLKNGNAGGDFSQAPRCGARARTRGGMPCLAPAIRGKRRCRMHGGKGSGPKTEAGKALCAAARLVHGRFTAAAKANRRAWKELLQRERFRALQEKQADRLLSLQWRQLWKRGGPLG